MNLAEDQIQKTSGANDPMQGRAQAGDQSGKALQTLQKSGASILMPLFDSLIRSQKILGSHAMDFIQQYYPPEKIFDILGIDGIKKLNIKQAEVVSFIERALKTHYDTVVDVTPLLGSDRERQFNQVLQLISVLTQSTGQPPPPSLLALLISVSDWPGKEALLSLIDQSKNSGGPGGEQQPSQDLPPQ